MGRRNKDRITRIEAGKEQSIAVKAALNNPVTRTLVAAASRKQVSAELGKASLTEQIEVLNSITPNRVGRAIMKKAPREIDKGIQRFLKQGQDVTIDSLLEEVRTAPGFLSMCERAGVTYAWFEQLARERIQASSLPIRGDVNG